MRYSYHWPGWGMTLFAALGVLVMLSLGIWQLQRLEWKQGLIAQAGRAESLPPLDIAQLDELEGQQYRRVRASGTWLHGQTLYLAGKYWGNKFGYRLLTPLALEDGRVLLVDRGWVPDDRREPETRPETMTEREGSVEGILREMHRPQFVFVDNDPRANLWFHFDRPAMERGGGTQFLPLYLEQDRPVQEEALPRRREAAIALRNDHLGYAVTWLGIGLAIAVMYLAYARKPRDADTGR